jgi:ribosomal protein L40E
VLCAGGDDRFVRNICLKTYKQKSFRRTKCRKGDNTEVIPKEAESEVIGFGDLTAVVVKISISGI